MRSVAGDIHVTLRGCLDIHGLKVFGMKAEKRRDRAGNEVISYSLSACSLGSILVASSATGVCAILLGDDADALVTDLQRRFQHADLVAADSASTRVAERVIAHVEKRQDRDGVATLDFPIDVRGTAFQHRVWQCLLDIPVGTTETYGQVARRIGQPQAVRAVANACGANAIAVIVPCHRVRRGDGKLSGYRWGVERKRTLLQREGVVC